MSDVEKPSEVSGTEAAATISSPTSILPRRASAPIQREVHRRIFVPDDRAKRGMHQEEMSSPKRRSSEAPTPVKKSARGRDRDLPRRILGDGTPPPGPKKRLASSAGVSSAGTPLKRRKQLHVQSIEQEVTVEAELQQLESRVQQDEAHEEEKGGVTPSHTSRQPPQQAASSLDISFNPDISPGYCEDQSSNLGFVSLEPASSSAHRGDDPGSREAGGSSPGYFVRQPGETSSQPDDFQSSFHLVSGQDSPRTPPGVSTTGSTAPSSPPMPPQKRERTMERLSPSSRGTSRRLNFD